MTRKEFVRICGFLGLSLPFQPIIPAKDRDQNVLIIGAGAAGISAGYLLGQQGISYQILEASMSYGGRMKTNRDFTDFPIPLGAEWIHVSDKELEKIINNPNRTISTQLKKYPRKEQLGYYESGEMTYRTIPAVFGPFYKEQKFVNSTWLTFFEDHLLPEVREKIKYGHQILEVDYSGEKVKLRDQNGTVFNADRVILTIPLKQLQKGMVTFSPSLPDYKTQAIQRAEIWGGIKIFIKFSEKFYPAFTLFPDSDASNGQRLYYDAAFGQNSNSAILGLFAVGEQAKPYQNQVNSEQISYVLDELDQVFNGKASENYEKHIVQNWDREPFIEAAYLSDYESNGLTRELSHPLEDKIFFAGTAYTRENDWGSVHNATRSAHGAVNELLKAISAKP